MHLISLDQRYIFEYLTQKKLNSCVKNFLLRQFGGKCCCMADSGGEGTPHIKGEGMLVGNFELNP